MAGSGKRTGAARAAAAALLAAAIAWPGGAQAQGQGQKRYREPDFITIGGGAFDLLDNTTSAEMDLQVRPNTRLWIFRPQIGLFANSDGGYYAWAGLMTDVYFGRRLVLSPSFGIGGYHKGDSKDLGGPLEFRSALELAWRFGDSSRLGVQFGHISNASIYDENPGTEFLLLNYSMPTGVFDR